MRYLLQLPNLSYTMTVPVMDQYYDVIGVLSSDSSSRLVYIQLQTKKGQILGYIIQNPSNLKQFDIFIDDEYYGSLRKLFGVFHEVFWFDALKWRIHGNELKGTFLARKKFKQQFKLSPYRTNKGLFQVDIKDSKNYISSVLIASVISSWSVIFKRQGMIDFSPNKLKSKKLRPNYFKTKNKD